MTLAVYTVAEDRAIESADPISSNSKRDFSLAAQPLGLNLFHQMRTSEENHKIKLAIKRALVSSDCDPAVKIKIFENMMNVEKNIQNERRERCETPIDISYVKEINVLLDEIRKSGNRIILDFVDFTNVNIKNLDLSNASFVSAKFNCMEMEYVVFCNTDFSSARFNSCEIRGCHFIQTVFSMTVFMKCSFVRGLLSNVTIYKSRFYDTNFDHVLVPQLKSDDAQLRKKIMDSEVCDLTNIRTDPAKSDPSILEFYELGGRMELGFLKDKFVKSLNFRHTSGDSQISSILILRTSLAVSEAVPELPGIVAELISQYACEDSVWAEQPLKTDFRTVIDNEENQTIRSAIKRALASPDCDPKIKRSVFKNMMDFTENLKNITYSEFNLTDREKLGENGYIQVINELLTEMRTEISQIILDGADFSGVNLSHLNLTGASAVSTRFSSMKMEYLVWKCGDFSGAQFNDVNILQCRFKDSIFNKSIFRSACFYLTELTNVQMCGVEFQKTKFDGAFANRIVTDDRIFKQIIVDHEITLFQLAHTYPDPEFFKKSLSAQLILQYAREESTQSVNFLACEFTTKRLQPKRSGMFTNFRLLGR